MKRGRNSVGWNPAVPNGAKKNAKSKIEEHASLSPRRRGPDLFWIRARSQDLSETLVRIELTCAGLQPAAWPSGSSALNPKNRPKCRPEATVQGFEPCRAGLESACSPRSTPFLWCVRQPWPIRPVDTRRDKTTNDRFTRALNHGQSWQQNGGAAAIACVWPAGHQRHSVPSNTTNKKEEEASRGALPSLDPSGVSNPETGFRT